MSSRSDRDSRSRYSPGQVAPGRSPDSRRMAPLDERKRASRVGRIARNGVPRTIRAGKPARRSRHGWRLYSRYAWCWRRGRGYTFLTRLLITNRASLGGRTSCRGRAHVTRPPMSGPRRGHRRLKRECRRPAESIQGGVAPLRALFGRDDATATKVAPRPCTGARAEITVGTPRSRRANPCR